MVLDLFAMAGFRATGGTAGGGREAVRGGDVTELPDAVRVAGGGLGGGEGPLGGGEVARPVGETLLPDGDMLRLG